MYELGIDLGTTFTAAAMRTGDRIDIVPLGLRGPVIPSVVLLGPDGTTLTGDAAQRRALTEPTHVAREFKRRLGDPLPVIVGGAPHSAESLSALVLRAVVDAVAALHGAQPGRVALTHPANWGSYKKELYAQAVRFADLPDVVFVSEPEAAAIHYASQERIDDGAVVAVYDLGGGTFDATVLRKVGESFEVLGQPEGIERLGGIDFDQAVFTHVAASLGGALESLDRTDPAALAAVARLRADCVDAKEALSADTEASIPVALPGLHTEVRITRPELESMLRRPIADTVQALRRALRDAAVEPEQLSTVLLVGGSSRIPMVAEMVGAELGRPVAVDTHPKYAVALGAARYAGLGIRRADDPRAAVVSAAAPPVTVAPTVTVAGPAVEPDVVEAVAVPRAVADAEPPAAVPDALPVAAPVVDPVVDPVVVPAPAPAVVAAERLGDPAPAPARARRRWPMIAAAAAAVAAVGIGAALTLGGGGGGDGAAAAADDGAAGCPSTSPFACITGASTDGGRVSADFRLTGVDLGAQQLVFFLQESPDVNISWDSTSALQWNVGQDVSSFTLCVLVNDPSAGIVDGSGSCVPLGG